MRSKYDLFFSKLFFLFLFLSFPLTAKQLFFSKDALSYRYQWLQESSQQEHHLAFYLRSTSFKLSRFKAYRSKNSQQYIEKKLKQHARTYDPKLVQFRFTKAAGLLELQIKSRDNDLILQAQKDFSKVRNDAEIEFLHQNYYQRFTDSFGKVVIKPDHQRIIKESLPGLKPISDAFIQVSKGKQQRYLLELMLSFMQSIPYDRLQSRDGLRGAGFAPPVQLLVRNKGDCDSKAALMLALLKNIYPETAMALIFVPEHAFIGLNIAAKTSDKTVLLDGVVFVVADPTGPSQLALGSLSKSSAHYLDGGLMQYELLSRQ